ncbi:MAG: metallophosphoesterase family protein [Methanobacteriota archaeon]|nr:MAG: metallophosphoesterase family protein [Euryarchaeota archaeon]
MNWTVGNEEASGRMGMIADIHSNLYALKAVFESLDERGVDRVVCAGDVVGYGAHPNECCREMRRRNVRSIAGNHDRASLVKETSRMNPYAAAAVIWTCDNLDEPSMRFLESLPCRLDIAIGGEWPAAVFHGSDLDPDEYVYEDEVDLHILKRCSTDLVVLGHTHVPFIAYLPGGRVINPGSVGQPRDGDSRASFAVLDTKSRRCDICRVEYDIAAEAEAILNAGLPAVLAERLQIGR